MNAWDRVAYRYDAAFCDPASDAQDTVVRDWLRPHVDRLNGSPSRPRKRLLDVGCGTGWLLDRLMVDPMIYRGLDLSAGMVDRAKSKYRSYAFGVDCAETLQTVPRETVDLLVSTWGVFSYSDTPNAPFRAAYRVLKPGGRMMAMVCSMRYAERRPHRHGEIPAHTEFWNPQELKELFVEQAGFVDVTVRGLVWAPRLAAILPRWLVRRWVRWEWELIGRRWPDRCFWLCVEATK